MHWRKVMPMSFTHFLPKVYSVLWKVWGFWFLHSWLCHLQMLARFQTKIWSGMEKGKHGQNFSVASKEAMKTSFWGWRQWKYLKIRCRYQNLVQIWTFSSSVCIQYSDVGVPVWSSDAIDLVKMSSLSCSIGELILVTVVLNCVYPIFNTPGMTLWAVHFIPLSTKI